MSGNPVIPSCRRTPPPARPARARKSRNGSDILLFASLSPRASRNQRVVVVERRPEAKQPLQQHVQIGRRLKILSPNHMGHPLQMVVHHHRQVVAGGNVAPNNHRITPTTGLCDLDGADPFEIHRGVGERLGQPLAGRGHIDAPGVGIAGFDAARDRLGG